MSLDIFLKQNKAKKENVKRVVSNDFKDENGNPIEWEFKHLSIKEVEAIRDECTIKTPVFGKKGQYERRLNESKLNASMISASVVFPDLHSAELQDSYGAMSNWELVREMVDNPGEYMALLEFINEFNGATALMEDDIEEAKN